MNADRGRFCAACGQPLPDDAAFCRRCGAAQAARTEPDARPRRAVWWIAGAVIVGILIVAVVFVARRSPAVDELAVPATTAATTPSTTAATTTAAPTTTTSLPSKPTRPEIGTTTPVGPEGAVVEIDGVTITIPGSAVPTGGMEVTPYRADTHPTAEGESLLLPSIGLDLHGAELLEPATITFTPDSLATDTADFLYSVRWDEATGQWQTIWDDEIAIIGDTVEVTTSHFSEPNVVEVDTGGWRSRFSNWAGQLLGVRSAAPECSGSEAPYWVKDVIYVEDLAAVMLVCTEVEDDLLVIKVVNNRTYSLVLTTDRLYESATQTAGADELYELFYSTLNHLLPDGAIYLSPGSEWEIRLQAPEDVSQLMTNFTAEILPVSITGDLIRGVLDALNIPVVDPLIEIVDVVGSCAVNEGLSAADGDVLGVIRSVIGCLTQFDENSYFDIIVETAIRNGQIDEAVGRKLASLVPFLRYLEVAQYMTSFLDLFVDTTMLHGDPMIGVLARRQTLLCQQAERHPYPPGLDTSGVVLLYDWYDDGTNAATFVMRLEGSVDGIFYEGGSGIGTFPLDDDYIATQWGEDGAAAAYVVEDGETTFCGGVDDARARLGVADGWPVNRNDGPPVLWAWFGANFTIPSWVSCYDSVCIAGVDAVVWVIVTDGISLVAEIPVDTPDPFQALIDLGASEELAKGLLAPEAP